MATNGGTAIVLKGAAGTQTIVDGNGKLTNVVVPAAAQSTAALTLTNGYGNTHGLVITETQTTLSGGTASSSLTMSDNGGTFSNSSTGAPVQVHGVNDGTADFDAVNVRQFSGAIASVSAMANIPQVDLDKTIAIGVGVGAFMSKGALALGASYRFARNAVLKGSVATGTNGGDTVVGAGAAWSF
ncbi:MAG: YadA C-terminal domain-containing protein [Betaproteobacteria bacterium]